MFKEASLAFCTDPIPSSKADFVNLITSKEDYKDAATKAAEADSLLD